MRKADPKAFGSSWYAATRAATPPRGPLTIELDVDVCVIGAGLAGLTAAREVARRGWSVVVLEAHSVAWNASGRNLGLVQPGFAADPDAIVTRVGLDHARQLWALSESGAEYVREATREPVMDGVALSETGWLQVSKVDDDRAMKTRIATLTEKFGAAVELWPAAQVRDVLRSPLYFHALHDASAFSVHPLNYALGLAASAEAGGARIFEDTVVLQVDPAGVRKRVVTNRSRVRAAHVVLAGNIHLTRLMPQFGNTLLPVYNYVIATAPLGDAVHDAIRFAGAVSDTELADNHYRVVDGDRLVWAGRSTVWRGKPQRYVDSLLTQMRRTYPQLKDARAEFGWSAVLGNTVHLMPQIGEISPGLWLLSGFGGHGINTTAMGGELIARAIVDSDTTWRLFSPFALVWAGGVFGRTAQQFYYWSHRANELIGGRLARRREARHEGAWPSPAVAAAETGPSGPAEPRPLLPEVDFAPAEAKRAQASGESVKHRRRARLGGGDRPPDAAA